jgi:hypothetical protein
MRGRPKGSLNKKTVEQIEAVKATGETPLDYMLRVMRDPKQEHNRRDDMAKSAAPYLHPKLASSQQTTEISGPNGGPIAVHDAREITRALFELIREAEETDDRAEDV